MENEPRKREKKKVKASAWTFPMYATFVEFFYASDELTSSHHISIAFIFSDFHLENPNSKFIELQGYGD